MNYGSKESLELVVAYEARSVVVKTAYNIWSKFSQESKGEKQMFKGQMNNADSETYNYLVCM